MQIKFHITNLFTAQESISKLEGDLNTLDKNIFVGLDEIERLKVTRLLSDLGIKNISPKLVIDNHIIPAFKSGKWKVSLFLFSVHDKFILWEKFPD